MEPPERILEYVLTLNQETAWAPCYSYGSDLFRTLVRLYRSNVDNPLPSGIDVEILQCGDYQYSYLGAVFLLSTTDGDGFFEDSWWDTATLKVVVSLLASGLISPLPK